MRSLNLPISTAFVHWFAVLVLGGCKQQPPPAAPVVNRCALLDAANRAQLSVSGSAPTSQPSAELVRALRAATLCRETKRGAWGIELSDLRTEDDESSARWSLVHVSAAGARASVTPDTSVSLGGPDQKPEAKASNLLWSQYHKVVPSLPTLFDYDGDGELEAVVIVETRDSHESGYTFSTMRGRVWSAAHDAIELYPPTRDLLVEEVRDIDADHRPDLLTHGPFAELTTIKCGSEESYPVYGPLLLAHSLPTGAFSLSDAQSLTFAQRECPALPKPLIVAQKENPDFVDFAATAKNVACSVLWDAASASMTTEVSTRCTQRGPCPTCDDAVLLTRWATVVPPLRLSGPH